MTRFFEALLGLFTFPLAALPQKPALLVGGFLGRLAFRLLKSRRNIAIDNVRQAIRFGNLKTTDSARVTARRSFENLGRSVMEMIKIYHGLDGPIIDRARIVGSEHCEEALRKNKGLAIITGHCGNWEILGMVVASRFGAVHVLAKSQSIRVINKIVEDMRARRGNRSVYPRGAVRELLSAIKKRENIGLLIDQSMLDSEGCLITFFGRPALSTKLPSLLARKTGVPLVPFFIHRDDDGRHTVTIHPALEISDHQDREAATTRDMNRLAGYVEDHIRRHPTQWLWGHRRWKNVPAGPLTGPSPGRGHESERIVNEF